MHLKSKYTLFQCISLGKTVNAPLPDQDENGKDKEDEEGDKLGAQGYQDPKNIVNVIPRSLPCARSCLSSQPYSGP
jgi:hypothetical protein